MISSLKENQIFVFGSNLGGVHAGGAAKQAKEQFGAAEGVGEGLIGTCYAFPTLTMRFRRRHHSGLVRSRDKLYSTARALPEKQFLLTKVGCGIAGYDEEYMKSLFRDAPKNVTLPKEWQG